MEALDSFLFFLRPVWDAFTGFIPFLIVFFSIYFYHKFSDTNKQVIANKDSDINRYPWLWYAESFGIVFISFIVAVGILGKFHEIEKKDSKNKSKKEEQKNPDKEVSYPLPRTPEGGWLADPSWREKFKNEPFPYTPSGGAPSRGAPSRGAMTADERKSHLEAIEALKKGINAFKNQDFNSAIIYFTKAIEFNPKHADSYNRRGDAYKALGKTKEAEADFAKAKSLEK